jgi:aspartate aminotransferase
MKLANRLEKINEPQTIKMAKLSREMRAKGIDVIDLSLGEPDFATPEHIQQAAIQAMKDGYTKYTPVAGYPELREAIVHKLQRDNHITFNASQVLVCTGAKQCIANVFLSLLNEGDEVIIPSPYWVTYADLVSLADGTVVQINTRIETDFKITPAQLEAAITPNTKAFIFSSPCNPSGSIYTREELKGLVDVFAKHPNIIIISDEIYEYINFCSCHESIAQFPEMHNRVVVINGLSKGYAMTGWRLGYMAGPQEIITACEKIQSQFTSGANSITQRAAITALLGDMAPTETMRQAFEQRRNFVVNALQQIPNLRVNNPQGAFYVFPDASYFIGHGTIQSSLDLCMYLLNEGRVSCVAGEAFGDPNCFRISYATSMDKLEEAVKRLQEAFAKLQR